MIEDAKRKQKFALIILAYPLALILISVAVNLFWGISPIVPALPSKGSVVALILATVLLVMNHIWLMTSTELTRLKYRMYATPEEWAASGLRKEDTSQEGLLELERRHNAHRNTTENTVYFVILAFLMSLISPTQFAIQLWSISFAVARLGYTFSYLSGQDTLRGIFMSAGLMSIFGMMSYLTISAFI